MLCTAAFHTLYVQVHILLVVGRRRRREVCCDLNFVCRAFRERRFAGGLFGCLVLIAWHPCVNFILWRLLFVVVSALAGAHKAVISAGGNSELNSFHLGQDCPQSFLNLTPSIWAKSSSFLNVDLPSGASFGYVVLNLDPSIWLVPFEFYLGQDCPLVGVVIQECGFNVY